MTKQELIEKISAKTGSTKTVASAHLDAFIEAVKESLANNDKVTLVGFGSFETVERDARTGRNPSTGETINIPAKTVPKFTPSSQLKSAVAK